MRRRLQRKAHAAGRTVELVDAPVERLPFEPRSFDAVITTLVLCSVPDQPAALAEIARVLRPGGRLIFLEHVRDSGKRGRQQDRAQPLVTFLGAGCHPNRATPKARSRPKASSLTRSSTTDPRGARSHSWKARSSLA